MTMQIKLLIKSMSYKFHWLIFALFLTGCALIKPHEEALHKIDWKTRKAELEKIKDWDMYGSISITQAHKTDMGTFYWSQQQGRYVIELSGPMSLNTIRMVGDGKKVTLKKSKGEQITASSPEELLFEQFGWRLPISNLVYWIKAQPAPVPVQSLQLDSYNHLVKLKQQGWNLEYLMFKSFNGVDLPTKIYLWNDDLKIKIVIKKIVIEN